MKLFITLVVALSFIACDKSIKVGSNIRIQGQLSKEYTEIKKAKICGNASYILVKSEEGSISLSERICESGSVKGSTFYSSLGLNISYKEGERVLIQDISEIEVSISVGDGTEDVFKTAGEILEKESEFLYSADLDLEYSATLKTDNKLNDYLKCYEKLDYGMTSGEAEIKCRRVVYELQ